MKNFFIAVAILFACNLYAQDSNYKVVFDMTSKDSMNQQSLLRQLNIIRELNPSSQLEVVMYGQGVNLALKDGASQPSAVTKLLEDKNISFKVCGIALERLKIDKSRLLPGVQIVPDGIYEIIVKQREGWGYIKVAN